MWFSWQSRCSRSQRSAVRIQSSANLHWTLVYCQLHWKDKNEDKEVVNGPFFVTYFESCNFFTWNRLFWTRLCCIWWCLVLRFSFHWKYVFCLSLPGSFLDRLSHLEVIKMCLNKDIHFSVCSCSVFCMQEVMMKWDQGVPSVSLTGKIFLWGVKTVCEREIEKSFWTFIWLCRAASTTTTV